MANYEAYELVIGLEVHVQLSTKSKAFCGDDTSFGATPNTQIGVISLGLPGTLPRLNEKQVEYAVRLGLALGSQINKESYFDRKNYFYSDLPKGYQITQDNQPICQGGVFDIKTKEGKRTIRIHHIHMEEDAGKSIHDQLPKYSQIDLNRAGVPLLEVVTEPDFRAAEEVDLFMHQMRQLVRYLEISDGNMEQGSMRCDCNISVRKKGATTFGQRCEVKNMNSMRFARKAIEFEFKRQVDLIESGGQVLQQTLNFDPVSGTTSPLRDKEDAHDYRYFPEPDIPPIRLAAEDIDAIKAQLDPMPWAVKKQMVNEFNLSDYDATILTERKDVALYVLELLGAFPNSKAVANLFVNKVLPYLNEHNIEMNAFPLSRKNVLGFLKLIEEGKVSSSIAYQRLFPSMIENPDNSALNLAESLSLIQSNDTGFLESIITKVLAANPDKVKAYQKGKKGLIGFFMGEVMRQSKGKAEPKSTNSLLRKMLE